MSDPRLNSIHLDSSRREEFRRVRDLLLQARGNETIHAESLEAFDYSLDRTGLEVSKGTAPPKDVKYYLKDDNSIYPLKIGLNTIGRLPDNDVVIENGHISRRHCAIVVHVRNGCEIHDVASKNGTFLNGERLAGSVHLKSGDEIRMCDHPITFVSQSDVPSDLHPALAPTV